MVNLHKQYEIENAQQQVCEHDTFTSLSARQIVA